MSRISSLAAWVVLVLSVPSVFAQHVPLDFSTAGYAANERAIPNAPVRIVVSPVSGDSTTRIQAAIDYVSSLTPDTNGLRGGVLLLAGRHEIFGGLLITNSGIVLRGQGVNATTLLAAGLDRRTLIRVLGHAAVNSGPRIPLTETAPVGAQTFHVADASAFGPLSPIRLNRPSTTNWIARLRAHEFGGGVGGGWRPGSRDITWARTISAIEGNHITLDAPPHHRPR